MAPRSPLPAHVPLWYRTQGHTSRGKAQVSERERREYRGVEFCRPCGWLTGHGRAGCALDHLYRTPAYAAGNVVHPPVSRNQCRYDTRLDLYIPRCGRRSGMDAPVGAADGRGNPLWSWPCFAMPGCTVRCSACASHGYGSSPIVHQTPLPLGEKVHICPFNEQS
jgi:hypothetical protein